MRTTRSPVHIAATLALAFTCAAPATAQDPPLILDGHSAPWWGQRLKADGARTQTRMIAHGADAVPMLHWLVEHGDGFARYRAARTLGVLRPATDATRDLLLRHLVASDSWWLEFECAHALALIGDDREAVRAAMLAKITGSEISRHRIECVRALARLRPDASALLLAAVDEGRFAELDWAIEALVDLGQSECERLLDALEADGPRGHVAREAVVGIGWPVAAQLEKRGHRELAHRCLTEGALHDILGIEAYRIAPMVPEPMATSLPEIVFAYGDGHGNGLSVWRAREGPRGFRVTAVAVFHPRGRGTGDWALKAYEATIPRSRALALTRQLALLGRLDLQPREREPDPDSWEHHWGSTGNFCTYVHAETAAGKLLDVRFSGYPGSDNVARRAPAEAARNALFMLTRGAVWSEREVESADRTAVAQCIAAMAHAPNWVNERLRALAELAKHRPLRRS